MNQIAVEVFEDQRRPQGGHAIIRLRGLNVLPSPTEYRIEPVDGLSNVSETSDWPLGPRQPVEARVTEQGVELVAGPDVVESPHLLPGTPVVISVPAAGVEAEILWPNVTPLARTERRPVIALPNVMAMAIAQQEHAAGVNGAGDHGTNGSSQAPRSSLSSLSGKHVNGAPPAVSRAQPSAGPASDDPPGLDEYGGPEPLQFPDRPAMRDRVTVRRIALRPAVRGGAAVEGLKPADELQDPARYYPIERYTPAADAPVQDKASRRLAAIAIAVAVVAALSSILGNLLRPSTTTATPPGPAMASAGVARTAVAPGLAERPTLYDVLATGPVSPRGSRSDGISMAKALEQADARLHGPAGARDPAEGAYWLKRALAASLADPRAQWALTQLGSLYAEPLQGEPDYGKARLLWEIAGGLGDPVALCFLGSLSEFGIGGGVDKAAAAEWYGRAKKAGGCRQIDDALKRVIQ